MKMLSKVEMKKILGGGPDKVPFGIPCTVTSSEGGTGTIYCTDGSVNKCQDSWDKVCEGNNECADIDCGAKN